MGFRHLQIKGCHEEDILRLQLVVVKRLDVHRSETRMLVCISENIPELCDGKRKNLGNKPLIELRAAIFSWLARWEFRSHLHHDLLNHDTLLPPSSSLPLPSSQENPSNTFFAIFCTKPLSFFHFHQRRRSLKRLHASVWKTLNTLSTVSHRLYLSYPTSPQEYFRRGTIRYHFHRSPMFVSAFKFRVFCSVLGI